MNARSFDGLPPILQEIAEVAGLEAALQLARQYSGLRIKIPRRARPRHWLVDCVGRKAADALCNHFSVNDADGKPVEFETYIPLGNAGHTATGLRQLAKDIEQGKMPREAARRSGFSERTAYRVKERLRSPGTARQPDLFATRSDKPPTG